MELEDDKKVLILRPGIAVWTHNLTLACISFWNLQKKKLAKGWDYSTVVKTKLLTLSLLWAYRITTKCTLHHIGIGFTTIFHVNPTNSQELLSQSHEDCFLDIWNSMHMDILVRTGMYEYVPVHTMLVYVFAYIGMYQYIKRRTDLYWLVLVCTSMCF